MIAILDTIKIWLIGRGIITISSISKIKNTIAIIKNWLENSILNLEFDSNPHSTFDLDTLYSNLFCSKEWFSTVSRIPTIIAIEIFIGMFISDWEFSLHYLIKIIKITLKVILFDSKSNVLWTFF